MISPNFHLYFTTAEVPGIARIIIRLAAVPPTSSNSTVTEHALRAQYAHSAQGPVSREGRENDKNRACEQKIPRK